MNWYLVEPAPYDNHGPFGLLSGPITDREGKRLESAEAPVQLHEVRKGVDVRSVGDAYLSVGKKKRIGDCLCYRWWRTIIVSRRVIDALDAAGIAQHPAVYRWRLNLDFNQPREYCILWPTRLWQVLDLGQSRVEFYSGTNVVYEVKHWVLDESRIPSADLVPTEYKAWIASERVKNVIDRHGFTGFMFTAVASGHG
jgi:hypothetical protein